MPPPEIIKEGSFPKNPESATPKPMGVVETVTEILEKISGEKPVEKQKQAPSAKKGSEATKSEATKTPSEPQGRGFGQDKEALVHAKIVIQEAMAEDPIVRQVFAEKPIKSLEVEQFIADRLEVGKGLVEIGRDLNTGVYEGKFTGPVESFEAMKVLNRIQQATGVEFPVMRPHEFGAPTAVEDLFHPSGNDPIITNPELARIMKEIKGALETTFAASLGVHDTDIPQTIKTIGRGVARGQWPKDQADEAVNRIQRVIEEIEKKQRGRAGARMGTATPSASPSWIDKEPVTDNAGNPITISNPDLQRGLDELRDLSSGNQWDPINDKFTELRGRIRASLSPGELEYFDKLWEIASKRFKPGMHGSHWSPTAEEIYELQASTIARDKKFYDLIHKVLDNPNEEAYKQFDLYDKYNFDQFTDIIGKTTDAQGHLAGDKLRAHYQNLYDTIMRLSDADYWAVHSAGDVEGLQKHMNFFKNSFAIEAISDPIAEQMMSCYEQAAEFIRDLHDQYLPNELFAHHAVRYGTYIDDLAEKLFRQRVDAGAVHDSVRDPVTGLPVLDEKTNGIEGRKVRLEDKALTLERLDSDDEAYQLRVKAARRMGKGMGIMTLRFTETLAFTRTPGDQTMKDGINGEFSKKIAGFSSKPYGGITRWHNPMSEWMRMYGFGDTLFVPFFNALAGAPPSETKPLLRKFFSRDMLKHPLTTVFGKQGQATEKALSWSLDQVIDVMNIADTGDKELLKKKYGEGVIRLYDKLEEMAFTGRMGPGSMWGIMDSTIEWKDWDRERLGGSMRLIMVETLASSLVEDEFKEKFKNKFGGEWKKTVELQEAWLKTKFGETSALNVLIGKEGSAEWKKKVEDLSRTYKTWVWTQYVMRNPQGAAAHIFVDYGAKPDGKPYRAKLKSKILHEIFKKEDLQPYQGRSSTRHFLEGDRLVVERDIASARELTSAQYALMERVRLLDGDLMGVQSYAMNNLDDPLMKGRPRDIDDKDFVRCINGNIVLQEGGVTVTVDEATRRRQAKDYFKMVQREFFGKARGETGSAWDVDQWREALQPYWVKLDDAGKVVSELLGPNAADIDHQNLRFKTPDKIDKVFKEASKAAGKDLKLDKDRVDRRILVHMGTEDVQWRYLDLNVLGERHWGRRGNDFATSAKTDQLMMEAFHMLTGNPDMDKLVEHLQKIGVNEKGHDPKEAAKRVSEWGWGMATIYRQRKLAGVPFMGRILPTFGIPMSIAQERFGTNIGACWSINNLLQFRDKLAATRVIPYKRIMDGRDYGPYTMEQFGRNLGASRPLALLEMLIIGGALAAALTALLAVTESNKEAKEQ